MGNRFANSRNKNKRKNRTNVQTTGINNRELQKLSQINYYLSINTFRIYANLNVHYSHQVEEMGEYIYILIP